ncbi:MAG: (2Fe-2S) ferredoxin domain-containing protein [Nitrospirae bacterium]|nr:(2Fe-2S) ferredoxin domain-containing protein [Nitrospirota bacterium]
MPKLAADDLKKIKDSYRSVFTIREGGQRVTITVHMGTSGIAAGARSVMEALLDELHNSGVSDVIANASASSGVPGKEPMATVEVAGESPVTYGGVDAIIIKKIFREHVLNGSPLQQFIVAKESEPSCEAES